MADASTRCGFIGLGSQGAPIARRMAQAGYPLVLWARRPASLEPFADTAATVAATVAELGAQCGYVGVCVVNDADVREVCGQLIPAMPPGGLIVIHSTVHPDTCRALAAEAAARGLSLIDAPVSGGQPAAEAGTLTVMIGGEAEAVAKARPVIETFGGLIAHLGGVGAGQLAKLVNNALMAANLGLAQSAVAAGEAIGVDRATLLELLKASSGGSYSLNVYARLPSPAAFGQAASLLDKDVRLLGEVLGPGQPDFQTLRDAAVRFIDAALPNKPAPAQA